MGRFEDIERTLKEAQTASPQNPEPSLSLAGYYDRYRRHSDTQKLLLDLKQKFPQDMGVATKVALTFMQNQPERAQKEIDQILQTDPKNPVGHILLGELQFYRGDYVAAEATLSKDLVTQTAYPEPHFFLGNIALAKGQMDQAQEHFQKSIALNNGNLNARTALAELLLKKGMLPDARTELNRVLQTQADNVPARVLVAMLDTLEKKYDNAEKEFSSLIKEEPENAFIWQKMGFYYLARGLAADAEKSWLRALQLWPDSQDVLQDLTRFYIQKANRSSHSENRRYSG